MKPIKLTKEHLQKLAILANEVAPYFAVRVTQSKSNTLQKNEQGMHLTKDFEHIYVYDTDTVEPYPWLEFCLTQVIPRAAHYYTSFHVDCTNSWAIRMIQQKIAHEIESANPIDTLYDIITNPSLYAQGL